LKDNVQKAGAGEWVRISVVPLTHSERLRSHPRPATSCPEEGTLGSGITLPSQGSRRALGPCGQVRQCKGIDLLQHRTFPLTSFSPQILLIIELEAGLEEGPRTPTTPLGRIWHTVGNGERKHALDFILSFQQMVMLTVPAAPY